MADSKVTFIKNWRESNPRLAVVDRAFEARKKAQNSFFVSIAETLRPHFEEFGITPLTRLEGMAWSVIVEQIPTSHNFFLSGLYQMVDEALAVKPECFDRLLTLEALCRLEIRIRESWPELTSRFHDHRLITRQQIADLATYTRSFPYLDAYPIQPISDQNLPSLSSLAETAEAARLAAHSRLTHPRREEAFYAHHLYPAAWRLFKQSIEPLALTVGERLTAFLEERDILPPAGYGKGQLRLFLERARPLIASAIHPAVPAALPHIPTGRTIPPEIYAARLSEQSLPLGRFLASLSGPIKILQDIPFIR